MKVAVIIGTRPEAIKLSPVIYELKNKNISTCVINTGQQPQLTLQTLKIFDIIPDYTFDLSLDNNSFLGIGNQISNNIDRLISKLCLDYILVQGDTTSALFGALAGFYNKILVGHVEAGLRSMNKKNPFPEEINRQLISKLADNHFAPTSKSKQNLINEGVKNCNILVTGNTVIDALDYINNKILKSHHCTSMFDKQFGNYSRPYIFITCHRREKFGNKLVGFCNTLIRLSRLYPNYDWIFSLHPNPNVRLPILKLLSDIKNIKLIDPVDYILLSHYLRSATLIITDSGGLQEEAPYYGVPVIVTRDNTERPEGVDAGFATIAGDDPGRILRCVIEFMTNMPSNLNFHSKPNPYGDGRAASRIVAYMLGEYSDDFTG